MKVNIVMPKMGESINEGTIIKWYKKKGDEVKKDEIIFEISTDKVDTEIPSPAAGVLSEIRVFEQETVNVDTVVAVIETDTAATVSTEEPPVIIKDTKEPSTRQVGGQLIDIPMPKMGESIMEGTIIKWHKKVGDAVKKDEIIFEISTDKVDTEVPSPQEGILAEILVNEQQTVDVGTVVARITAKGGIVKESISEGQPPKAVDNIPESPQPEVPAAEVETVEQTNENKGFYSPLVLNIARKENIGVNELDNLQGTGLEGRVTKKDVLNYVESRKNRPSGKPEVTEPAARPEKATVAETGIHAESIQAGENSSRIPMDNIRQKIMSHMIKSRDISVHVSGVVEVDMVKIYNFIKNNKEDFLKRENLKLTYTPFIAYACVKALKAHPYLNASIDGTNIVLKRHVNLGIAVAVEPNGLIVPNIKNAGEKNITGLARAIAELSTKSRNRKLTPEDISDGTFTITNYGVFGTLFGTPIINQPELAILGVGAVVKKPVVIESDGAESIAIRPMMYLSLSHDHRLIDGMLGGKFLKGVKDALESFDSREI